MTEAPECGSISTCSCTAPLTCVATARQAFPATSTAASLSATVMGALHDAGRDKVTILAPHSVEAYSLWAEQLIAESTGKEGKGIIPIGDEPIGDPAVYSDDRLFVALRIGDGRRVRRFRRCAEEGRASR